MCIVIDTNTLALVFKKETIGHIEFKPVLDWILTGKGKMIIGGDIYLSEIRKAGFFNMIIELKKYNKITKLSDSEVNEEYNYVKELLITSLL